MKYFLGVDMGSVSVKAVLVSSDFEVIDKKYIRHHGQSIPTTVDVIDQLLAQHPHCPVEAIAFTGNGASMVAELMHAHYVNEVIAQAKATARLYPHIRSIIEIGGEDAKLVKMEPGEAQQPNRLKDFGMNTVCAAGTGSFLDQQAARLGVSIEKEFGAMAVTSVNPPRIAGRCSVFAKSDMIHLQQTATPVPDILMGLCLAMAKNFKSNVAKGETLEKPISFQGGVAANAGMIKAFEQVLELQQGELFVPEHYTCMGALGAVLSMTDSHALHPFSGTSPLKEYLRKPHNAQHFLEPLGNGDYPIHTEEEPLIGSFPVEVFLGVDIGSISTNLVLIDNHKRVVARRYLMTGGNPLEAVKKGLAEIGEQLGDKVKVCGVATTGSGRYLTGDFIGADVVKNEITAHARGAVNVNPEVDTIFEIGGQDSKYISLKDGVVVDYTMNKVCAAGTGSFLQEQAEKLNVNIREEFSSLALSASSPSALGERCTVFMESSLNKQQQMGTPREDLLAGLGYSIVKNYLSTVVEKRPVGDVILFQGGTAYNRAVKAAFEKVLGKKIIVPPHHDVLGALGCALIAMENRPAGGSRFRGFDLAKNRLEFGSFVCQDCSNDCEIRTVKVEGSAKPLTYGSRCGKFDEEKQKGVANDLPRLFREREKMLMHTYIPASPSSEHAPVVAIPRSLLFYEMYPFWNAFFSGLGFKVITSPPSSRGIITRGCEAVVEEVCFPVKLAMGHTLELLRQEPDYLFLPCVVNGEPVQAEACGSSICPLVQGFPYMSDAALDFSRYPSQVLRPVFHFENADVEKELHRFARQLGYAGARVRKVVGDAFKAQADFRAALLERGAEVLDALPVEKPTLVIVSRPYNGCDPGLNLRIPEKLRDMNVLAIPVDFLPVHPSDSGHMKNMYWRYGQRILSAAEFIARTPKLHALYITNFACGPDSFIIKYFQHAMNGKQMLTLELDEHSADAGVITRLEAFLDSLESVQPAAHAAENGNYQVARKYTSRKRKIYIPHIDDHGRGVAAALRYNGIASEAMPMSDREGLELARQYVSGKECYPFMITAGDILRKAREKDFDPAAASFFMPTTNGPCRFGQYCHSHQLILEEAGLGEAQMITIDQATGFDSDLQQLGAGFRKLVWQIFVATDNIKKLLLKTRPYEVARGQSDKVYETCITYLENCVEQTGAVGDSVKYATQRFAEVPLSNGIKKPLIGIIGEIFVRSNDFSNNFIIRQIEELGGEVAMPTFHEWILYTDWERRIDLMREGDFMGYAKEVITSFVQKYYTRRETKPLKGKVERFLYEMPVNDLMKLSEPYLTRNLRGEATLSIARAEEYARHGFHGVLNLTPFHCMPGTIANTLLVRFAKKYPRVPVLKMVYDGTEQSGERARLEAFMFQTQQMVRQQE